ncbi:hypothetical protein H6786_04300 [Candidatus Nomurabacteria bacterium]|nr:hypothetical protein [Candidatus Nomurabacteria bacterium]
MNEEQNDIQTPHYEGEVMKMPENTDATEVGQAAEKSMVTGPILAMLVALLIVILGGMYYWLSTMNQPAPAPVAPVVERPTPEENNEPESTTAEAQTEVLTTVSTSDEISAIEADLESTDLDSLDAELDAIDAELDAALEGQ